MSNGPAMRPQLADPGWLQVDEATLRISGQLDDVVRDMSALLRAEDVRSLCAKLGILSSGFFFIDPHEGWIGFFDKNKRKRPRTYRTPYVWSNATAGRRWSELVHSVFVQVRALQRRYRRRAGKLRLRGEDFFRYIPKDGKPGYCVGDTDRSLRLMYALHYVTLGEMLYSMLLWRGLTAAVARGDGDLPIHKLNVGLDDAYGDSPACLWAGVDLLKEPSPANWRHITKELREAWALASGGNRCLRREWNSVGLRTSDPTGVDVAFAAVVKFAVAIGVSSGKEAAPSPEALNTAMQRGLPLFLSRLGAHQVPRTIRSALSAVERYARFPILPFYVWTALDGVPKCYLVVPVWTSQQYWVDVDDIACTQCRHLGLALSAVSPLRRLDWTLPASIGTCGETGMSDADPVAVANLIRTFGRPLVEEHLYGREIRELKLHVQLRSKGVVAESGRRVAERQYKR